MQYFGWICTGPMVQGTLWDGLAYSWIFIVIGLFCALSGIVLLLKVKQKLPKYLISAVLITAALGSFLLANFLYRFGVECKSDDSGTYKQMLRSKGLE